MNWSVLLTFKMMIAVIGLLACYIGARFGIGFYPAVFQNFADTNQFSLPGTLYELSLGLFLAGFLSMPMVFFHLGLDVLTGLFIRRDISLWLRATTAIAVVAGGALLAFSVPIWIVAAAAGIVAASLFFMAKRAPGKSLDTVA